jgi:hypothetical protein
MVKLLLLFALSRVKYVCVRHTFLRGARALCVTNFIKALAAHDLHSKIWRTSITTFFSPNHVELSAYVKGIMNGHFLLGRRHGIFLLSWVEKSTDTKTHFAIVWYTLRLTAIEN